MMKDTIACGTFYLDTDTDPKLNKGSDFTLNCVMSNNGRYGVITNSLGNIQKIDFTSIVGFDNPKVLGVCADSMRNRFIFFIYDTVYLYGIIQYYDIISDTLNLIMSIFDWNGTMIDNPKVVGDLLFWTDNIEPRKVNYVRMYNFANGVSTLYKYTSLPIVGLASEVYEAYRRPPLPISNIYGVADNDNFLRGKSYQFSLRYIYEDNEKSVLSSYSSIYYTDAYGYFVNGEYKSNAGYTGYILEFIYWKEDVNTCEIYVRDNEKSDWYLYDTIKALQYINKSFQVTVDAGDVYELRVPSDVHSQMKIGMQLHMSGVGGGYGYIVDIYTSGIYFILELDTAMSVGSGSATISGNIKYTFDDSRLRIAKDQKELSKPFDFLPIKAGRQELIEKNRIIYANITEGYDLVDINASISVNYQFNAKDIPIVTAIKNYEVTGDRNFFIRFNAYPSDVLYGMQFIEVDSISSPTRIITRFIDIRYVSKSTDTPTTILTYFKDYLVKEGLPITSVTTVGGFLWLVIKWDLYKILPQESFGFAYSQKVSTITFKFGGIYNGGTTYYDKDRRHSFVNKFKNDIVIPHYSSSDYTQTDLNRSAYLLCSIKNIPPDWAYYYSIDLSKRTNIGAYWHILGTQISQAGFTHMSSYFDYFWDTGAVGYLKLKINNIINYAHDNNSSFNLSTYIFEKGDRIRAIAQTLPYITRVAYQLQPIKEVIDVEILSMEWPDDDTKYLKDKASAPAYITDANGNKVPSDYSSYLVIPLKRTDLPIPPTGMFIDFLFEIYKPIKKFEDVKYYPQVLLEIGNPGQSNRYHKGNLSNQLPSDPIGSPAISSIYGGDTYLKLRDCKYIYACTDDSYSDYYTSDYYGTGRPNIYDPEAKQVNLIAGMRYSGRLLENTKINEFNKFEYDDLVVLKSKYGTINKIIEVGDVLKVLQDKKETSIYVGKEEMTHPDGNVTLITSNKVLGTQNSYDEERGTLFSLGVVVHNRDMYYPDMLRGEIIRSSSNGQIPISEYGMKTYFKNIFNTLSQLYTIDDICSGYDEENKIYFITIKGIATLGFYEPLNKWISFYSFRPDIYISSGIYFGSVSGAGFWKHNDTTVNRCTFYGVKYKQQVNWYSNLEPAIKKLYRSVGVKSNKAWSIPVISIEADSTYIRGMVSKLNANHFELKEGMYFASYLNNMKTTSDVESVIDLINGDNLRGFYLKHEMENLHNDEVWTLCMESNFEPSNKF